MRVVNNRQAYRVEPATDDNFGMSPNLIGGFGGTYGPGNTFGPNEVTDHQGTVAGGAGNRAGNNDTDLNNARFSTVSGGFDNQASGFEATVGGGAFNAASGAGSVVPGGSSNTASGSFSFAAGRRAKAQHNGTFVWGDTTDADVASSAANQFVVRASGGATFYTNAAMTTGASLAAGSGSWGSLSDRAVKTGLVPANPKAVLERLAAMPIYEWSYRAQGPGVRHLGPTAQDFKAAFGLGEDDRHISTVDLQALEVRLAALERGAR